MLNNDYRDMLLALSAEGAKYLLVGAYAMAVHGYPRATMDMDLWVMPTEGNAEAVVRALRRFGAYLQDLGVPDLVRNDTVFQIGAPPRRIDIITGADGLQFEEAYSRSVDSDIDGIQVRVLSIDDLIKNKTAVGRSKDIVDVEALKRLKTDHAV